MEPKFTGQADYDMTWLWDSRVVVDLWPHFKIAPELYVCRDQHLVPDLDVYVSCFFSFFLFSPLFFFFHIIVSIWVRMVWYELIDILIDGDQDYDIQTIEWSLVSRLDVTVCPQIAPADNRYVAFHLCFSQLHWFQSCFETGTTKWLLVSSKVSTDIPYAFNWARVCVCV